MGKFLQMPKLGMTMESGKIMKWMCSVGDKIEKNDPFVEVQTDKVNLEVESIYEGVILKLYYSEGDDVPVTLPIAYIGAAGEAAPELDGQVLAVEETAANKETETKTKMPVQKADPIKVNTTKEDNCDLVIIGAGPGGYVAAIRAAQLGAKVTLIERDRVGGTCLNRGCIPTKTFVENANALRTIKEADKMGITVKDVTFDWVKVLSRKTSVVNQLVGGVEGLLKKNGVKVMKGDAKVVDSSTVKVMLPDDKETEIKTKHIIIATGTVPAKVNIEKEATVKILNTDEVLALKSLPKSMAVIGGGYIGSEIASIMNTFGVDISIIEIMPTILTNADEDVVKVIEDEFKNRGIRLYTNTGINKIRKNGTNNIIVLSDGKEIEVEEVFMAVGRQVENSAFESLGLEVNQKGYIKVNNRMEASIKNIYAIGDVTGNIQLAHVASAQGTTAVENMFGEKIELDYDVVPSCIFTYPEIASVGMTEKQVKDKKIPYKVFKFPFFASGKAVAIGETNGFVKIIADARWDEILGVHIIGPEASNLIEEAAVAMKLEATAKELSHTIHPHPTLSESLMEAAEGLLGKAIHI